MESLKIDSPESIVSHRRAGLFISQGVGRHPTRRLPEYEMIFVRSGRLGIAEEKKRFFINAGESLLLWPNRVHRGIEDYSPELSFYWIHFSLNRAARKRTPWLALDQHAYVARPERLSEWIHGYLDDKEKGFLTEKQASQMIGLMLLQLGQKKPPPPLVENAMSARAERHIVLHFREGIQASDVATAVKCNRDYLGRVYRQAFGRTVTEGIHLQQVNEACNLLREDIKNIEEIALCVGFRDTRNFRKVFTHIKGVSPQVYRNIYVRMHVNTR